MQLACSWRRPNRSFKSKLNRFALGLDLTPGVRPHERHRDDLLTIPAPALAIGFLPIALLVARLLIPSLRPPKHRPIFFASAGALLLVFGSLSTYALRSAVASGVVHFSSRRFGEFHANAADQPIEYWAVVLVIYSCGVALAGFGLAGVGLCFKRAPAGGP